MELQRRDSWRTGKLTGNDPKSNQTIDEWGGHNDTSDGHDSVLTKLPPMLEGQQVPHHGR